MPDQALHGIRTGEARVEREHGRGRPVNDDPLGGPETEDRPRRGGRGRKAPSSQRGRDFAGGLPEASK